MLKFFKLVFLFWRPLLVWNLLFSLAGLYGISLYGFGFFGVGLLIKIFGYSSSVYFQYHFSGEKKYFYLNAGQSLQKMYGCTFLADFCLYMLFLCCYFKF